MMQLISLLQQNADQLTMVDGLRANFDSDSQPWHECYFVCTSTSSARWMAVAEWLPTSIAPPCLR